MEATAVSFGLTSKHTAQDGQWKSVVTAHCERGSLDGILAVGSQGVVQITVSIYQFTALLFSVSCLLGDKQPFPHVLSPRCSASPWAKVSRL